LIFSAVPLQQRDLPKVENTPAGLLYAAMTNDKGKPYGDKERRLEKMIAGQP
jgi:hypothetical protein